LYETRLALFAAKGDLLLATFCQQLVAVLDALKCITYSRDLLVVEVVRVCEVVFVLLGHQVKINHLLGFFDYQSLMLICSQYSVILLFDVFNLIPQLRHFLLPLLNRVGQEAKR